MMGWQIIIIHRAGNMKTTPLPSSIEVFQNNVPDWRKTEINYPLHTHLLTQDRNQAYTSLVEGIKAQVKDINGESSVFDDFATDIIENVVNPLYGKE